MADRGKSNITPESFDNFGDLLRYLRHRAGITQRELAIQVDYHYSYLSRIERNERFPEANMILARFVPALGIAEEPAWVARLVALAAHGRGEAPPPPTITLTQTTAAPAERQPLPEPPPPPQPTDLPRLLGRTHEITILHQLLAHPEVRLLTLTGPPGIGKTSLALHMAAEIGPHMADGALFVDLSPVREPALLAPTLLQALGLPESAGHLAEEALLQGLHGRQQLLILDNFEQIISAAPLVSRLLRHAPQLKILVTSREILRLNGENEFAVPPLPTDPELGEPAVQLFALRAQAALPSWQLTAANQPAVAELCRRLDGLPLAIELASARIKLFSPEAMLARLDKRLGWLTGGKRDGHSWRQTLRGAIEWSYQLLSAEEKQLWIQLAVFMGGGTLTALEAVCGAELDTLVALAEKNLLTLRPALTAEEDLRFGWLESLREFAAEQLALQPDLLAQTSLAHARYYQHLVAQAEAQRPHIKTATWLANLDEMYPNLRAALTWAVAHQQGAIALGLCVYLIDYWEIRGLFGEGRYWLAAAVPLASAEPPSHLLARAWKGWGLLTLRQNDYVEAFAHYRHSLALWHALGDAPARAQAALDWGILLCNEQGRTHDHDHYFEEALAIYQQQGDVRGMANALNELAITAYYLGEYPVAQGYFETSLAHRRTLNDPMLVTGALNNLGLTAYASGDYAAARRYHEEALRLRQNLGFEGRIAQSRTNLALALIRLGELPQAEMLLYASIQTAVRQQLKFPIIEASEGLAMIAAVRRQPARAACLLGATTILRERLDGLRDISQDKDVAWVCAQLGPEVTESHVWQWHWEMGKQYVLEELTALALDPQGLVG